MRFRSMSVLCFSSINSAVRCWTMFFKLSAYFSSLCSMLSIMSIFLQQYWTASYFWNCHSHSKKVKVKVKVAHTRLPSVGFRSWSRFLAVSLQVMWVINPAVGCHYFPPGLQLPWQPLRGLLPISCLVNRGTLGVNSLPKTVTRQRHNCDLKPRPSAPESSTLTTRLPSQPKQSDLD